MSQFEEIRVACPGCGAAVAFEAVNSVNADRAPALRAAILDGSFQRQRCPQCAAAFRLEPEFNYVEHGRGLWVVVRPAARVVAWPEEEAVLATLFEAVYGRGGSPYMRQLGGTLRRRLVFGWAALREKLLCDDHALDDATLELCKAAALRASSAAPVGLGAELRLVAVDDAEGGTLHLAWQRSEDEAVGDGLRIRRALYDELAADADGDWAALRAQLGAGPFVDLNRLLVVTVPAAA
jgi:CpXC protein